jgi:hypothetical protein
MSRFKERRIKINNTPPSGVGLGPLVFLLPKFLRLWLSNILALSVPDEGDSRKVLCTINLISTFLLVLKL